MMYIKCQYAFMFDVSCFGQGVKLKTRHLTKHSIKFDSLTGDAGTNKIESLNVFD